MPIIFADIDGWPPSLWGGEIMKPFLEAQKNATGLAMKDGYSSVFGFLSQLLADIRGQNWTEAAKWRAWKDTCQKIRQLKGERNVDVEGCKLINIQLIFATLFKDTEKMEVSCFEDVIRYTEYCRRMALQNKSPNPGEVTYKSQNISKNECRDIDVSDSYRRGLLYYILIDPKLSLAEKTKIAQQAKKEMIIQKLWEKKDRTLQNLRNAIDILLNSKQL